MCPALCHSEAGDTAAPDREQGNTRALSATGNAHMSGRPALRVFKMYELIMGKQHVGNCVL